MPAITIETITQRWASPDRAEFAKGELIADDCLCCAQGDILRVAGWSDDELRNASETVSDQEVARLLNITVGQSVLIRHVNDSIDGCPEEVLTKPESVLGDQAQRILAFWRRLEAMTDEEWSFAKEAAKAAAREGHWGSSWKAADDAVGRYSSDAVRVCLEGLPQSAGLATNEIQGAAIMRERNEPFLFLPMFGIADPAELDAK